MTNLAGVFVAAAMLLFPVLASAQNAGMRFIGFLSAGAPNERAHMVEAFRKGLKEGGFSDGKDVAIEYRWAEGRAERLPQLAKELVDRKVSVIAASGGVMSVLAARSATSTIPIVFNTADDPVKLGIVASLRKPGGNATGIANVAGFLDVKRLEMLRELLPRATRVAYLVNPRDPATKYSVKAILDAAEATGTRIDILRAGTADEIDTALGAAFKQTRANALLVATNGLFTTEREKIVALASRHAIPATYSRREFVAAGGLMSYGPDYADVYRLVGVYTARILKGEKPADMPVIQETRFELVVNLNSARKLGVTLSKDFLSRVDEVIQ